MAMELVRLDHCYVPFDPIDFLKRLDETNCLNPIAATDGDFDRLCFFTAEVNNPSRVFQVFCLQDTGYIFSEKSPPPKVQVVIAPTEELLDVQIRSLTKHNESENNNKLNGSSIKDDPIREVVDADNDANLKKDTNEIFNDCKASTDGSRDRCGNNIESYRSLTNDAINDNGVNLNSVCKELQHRVASMDTTDARFDTRKMKKIAGHYCWRPSDVLIVFKYDYPNVDTDVFREYVIANGLLDSFRTVIK
jgi:hypothetical protein